MLARAVLLAASVAAVAWLGSAYPGAHAERRAAAVPASAPQRAAGLYADALRWRPDTVAGPRLAALEVGLGRPERAVARLRRVLDGEPENVTAWAVLALALAESDPDAAAEAVARRDALAPPPRR